MRSCGAIRYSLRSLVSLSMQHRNSILASTRFEKDLFFTLCFAHWSIVSNLRFSEIKVQFCVSFLFPVFSYFVSSEISRFLLMIIWTMDSESWRKCSSPSTCSALVSMKARIMLTSSEADV